MNTLINPTWIERREETASKRLQNMRASHDRLIKEVQSLRSTNKKHRETIAELKKELETYKGKNKPSLNHFTLAFNAIKESYPDASIKGLKSPSRKRELVDIRQVFYFIMRSSTSMTFEVIGKMCGGKDHTSVLHGCKVVENVMSYDKAFQSKVITINNRFRKSLTLNGI